MRSLISNDFGRIAQQIWEGERLKEGRKERNKTECLPDQNISDQSISLRADFA
jgi:hypothetical protein